MTSSQNHAILFANYWNPQIEPVKASMPDSENTDDGTRSTNNRDQFPDFWTWLTAAAKLRFKILGLAGIIVPILAATFYLTGIALHFGWLSSANGAPSVQPDLWAEVHRHTVLKLSYAAQIGLIALILLLYARSLDMPRDKRFEYGTEGQKRLQFWWGGALISFLLLYIVMWSVEDLQWTKETIGLTPGLSVLRRLLLTAADLCNNLSTFAFLMCFSTMEYPAKRGDSKNERWVLTWITFLIILTFVEGAVRLEYGSVVDKWRTDWFALITGTNAGIALAMFCGRVSSPLIDPPRLVSVFIYLYAVVQISFGFWGSDRGIALLMANLCLVLKCFLSLVIAWLLTTRHLILYMERLYRTRSDLNQWRNDMRDGGITIIKRAPREPA